MEASTIAATGRRGLSIWRVAILARLSDGQATVNQLVAPFDLSQPTSSEHLKVLELAGLVSRGRDAQFRRVRLNAAPLTGAARWLGSTGGIQNTPLGGENLDIVPNRRITHDMDGDYAQGGGSGLDQLAGVVTDLASREGE